ncbi:hypothetical protein [uncultured Bacteroides sp.]|uniref:hypothetical protein n=1 Tax=uncultured Bacteroides sp. TaxID=162156 RepID=UPI002AAA705C|nr:hypothetical protein [uncultured Bacteroides sp.]
MIETIAAIATILDFSMKLFDKVQGKNFKREEDQMIIFLICLSEKSRHLKKVHSTYHNLYYGFSQLDNFLINPREAPKYKRLTDVNRFDLSMIINQPIFTSATEILKNSLIVEMNHIYTKIDLSENDSFQFLKSEDETLATSVEKIITSQQNIVKLHSQYCDFFDNLKLMQDKDDLDDLDVKCLLSSKRLVSANFSSMINDTDIALMNYLDIYHFCMNYLKQKM